MEDGTTILFGLPGVAVDRVERHRDGRVAHVVTVDESAAIDATRRGRPRWDRDPDSGRWRRLDRFETNFVDLGGDGGLLGQTGGRTAAAVVAWLDARGEDWKAA